MSNLLFNFDFKHLLRQYDTHVKQLHTQRDNLSSSYLREYFSQSLSQLALEKKRSINKNKSIHAEKSPALLDHIILYIHGATTIRRENSNIVYKLQLNIKLKKATIFRDRCRDDRTLDNT